MNDEVFATRVMCSPKPVLCLFTAAWCGPSQLLRPEVEDAMNYLPEDVVLAEIDIEACPKAALRMQVRALPWMVIVKDGQPLGSHIGTMSSEQVEEWAKRLLNPPPAKAKKVKKK